LSVFRYCTRRVEVMASRRSPPILLICTSLPLCSENLLGAYVPVVRENVLWPHFAPFSGHGLARVRSSLVFIVFAQRIEGESYPAGIIRSVLVRFYVASVHYGNITPLDEFAKFRGKGYYSGHVLKH